MRTRSDPWPCSSFHSRFEEVLHFAFSLRSRENGRGAETGILFCTWMVSISNTNLQAIVLKAISY